MIKRVSSVDEAVEDMKQRSKKAMRAAVDKAADVMIEDIYKFSVSCIDRYYANYEPSIYDRTYQLYNTLSSVCELSDSGDFVTGKIGVRFDAGALGTHYHSTFWGTRDGVDNGHSEDILSDFLDGIHPMTSGSPVPGTPALMIQDGFSTDGLLIKYLSLYKHKFDRLISSYFAISI